jgi:flagellar biosynthetic protein FlhB
MADDQFERSEPATTKRREKFREKGQVAKSREVAAVALVGSVLIYWYFAGADLALQMQEFWKINFDLAIGHELTVERLMIVIKENAFLFVKLLGPFFAIVLAISFLSNILQTGWLFTIKPLMPDWNRVDPIAKFKELFLSTRIITETLINIMKVSVLTTVIYLVIESEMADLPLLAYMTPFDISASIMMTVMKIMMSVLILYSVVAVTDFLYQWFSQEKKMRMTKQEIKDEHKDTEGNPQIKGHMRARMREISMNKLIQNVPEADVIITNPTHIAIALRYDGEKEKAPRVLAKGKGFWAQRIREIAKENRIEIVEDKLLARALYKSVRVGQEIPSHFYRAVAEILAYVFRLQQSRKMRRHTRPAAARG